MRYTVLAVYREDFPIKGSVQYGVAYRNNMDGKESYFQVVYSMKYVTSQAKPVDLLMKSAYSSGGPDLAAALEIYYVANKIDWDQKPFSYSFQYESISDGDSIIAGKLTSSKIIFQSEPDDMMYQYVNSNWKEAEKNYYYDYGFSVQPKTVADSGISKLPGLSELVKHPSPKVDDIKCDFGGRKMMLKDAIIHLNDRHKWTREEIADWLETLDVDLRFKSEDDTVEPEQPEKVTQSDHHNHVHFGFEPKYKNDDQIALHDFKTMYEQGMKQHQLTFETKDVNPELLKLLMGESNEQD